jgi:hypothetical protein
MASDELGFSVKQNLSKGSKCLNNVDRGCDTKEAESTIAFMFEWVAASMTATGPEKDSAIKTTGSS